MSKYSDDELKKMADTVLSSKGTQQYRDLFQVINFFTGLSDKVILEKIEELANKETT